MSGIKSTREYAHICMSDGCHSIEYLPGQYEWVATERVKWAVAHKKEHGEFPDGDAQIQFIIDANDRYRSEVWSVVQRRAALGVVTTTPEAPDA